MKRTTGISRSISGGTRLKLWTVLLALGAIGLAACSGGSSTQSASSPYGSSSPTKKPAASISLGMATNAKVGQSILVDGSGMTVYLFVPDGTSTTSTVPTQLKPSWPPVASTGAPSTGGGLDGTRLSVQTQADGTRQLAYAGHLLYTFVGDHAPGDVNGQGLANNWYVVSTGGAAIGRASTTPSQNTMTPNTSNPTAGTHTTSMSSTMQQAHRRNDHDADNVGGPNDDDGNK